MAATKTIAALRAARSASAVRARKSRAGLRARKVRANTHAAFTLPTPVFFTRNNVGDWGSDPNAALLDADFASHGAVPLDWLPCKFFNAAKRTVAKGWEDSDHPTEETAAELVHSLVNKIAASLNLACPKILLVGDSTSSNWMKSTSRVEAQWGADDTWVHRHHDPQVVAASRARFEGKFMPNAEVTFDAIPGTSPYGWDSWDQSDPFAKRSFYKQIETRLACSPPSYYDAILIFGGWNMGSKSELDGFFNCVYWGTVAALTEE